MLMLIFVALSMVDQPSAEKTSADKTILDRPLLDRRMSIAEVVQRVDTFEPQLRVRVLDLARAEINLRRSEWNRVTGSAGFSGQDVLSESLLGAIPRSITAGGQRQDISPTNSHQLSVNSFAQVTFPLFAGGAIQYAVEAAWARVQAGHADVQTIRRDLRRTALVAYAQLLATKAQLDVSESALKRGTALVQAAERRQKSGLGTEADVARAKLTLLSEQEDLEVRRGDEALAQAAIRALLLLEKDERVVPTDALEVIAHYQEGAPRLRRPELVSLREQTQAAEFDRRVASGAYWPRLELFANATYGNGTLSFYNGVPVKTTGDINGYIGVFSGSLVAGARLTWTVFDFFVTRDSVASAEALRDQFEAKAIDEARQVRREADEAQARETQSEKRVLALSGGKEAAAAAVRLARVRYDSGNAILTEVLDAELQAISVESRQVQANFDHAVSHLERLRAEGGTL